MALITVSSTASFDARSAANAGYVSGLTAGSAITALAACRVDDDGCVYPAISTENHSYFASGSMADFIGFAPKAYAKDDAMTVIRSSAIASYSTGMTPGKPLWISGSAGMLADAVVLNGDQPVAIAISATDIVVVR